MQKVIKPILLSLLFCCAQHLHAQHLNTLIPTNTTTHTAVQNGNWSDPATWGGFVPDNAAIVHIPTGKVVTYDVNMDTVQLFAIRVDGEFNCGQTVSTDTTFLTFDTFIGTMQSKVVFFAQANTAGSIRVRIKPFPIEAHKAGTSGFSQTWNTSATTHFSDGAPVNKVVRTVLGDRRYNTYADALAGNTRDTILSQTTYNDSMGVTGRYAWDSTQLSLGIVTMGELEIIGKPKLNMVKLASDAAKGQKNIILETDKHGWKIGDTILVTRGGDHAVASNGEDVAVIDSIIGTRIVTVKNLKKNHLGRAADTLHCYAGNLTRNILFESDVKDQIHSRGHLMAMHNDSNIQIRNAAFKGMGRTDKSTLLDDFIWSNWRQTDIFKSKISPLGQEICEMQRLPAEEIINSRGRYSIHLHKTGTTDTSKLVHVTGNVIWDNPGWGITHHDSYANVSNNVVFDVTGAGIVSESGSELGFWDNNLVVDIEKGHTASPYDAAIFHEDYLFTGQGLGMKGRGVVCRGNVIANTVQGIGIMNMNPAQSPNQDRVNAAALATLRSQHQADHFPLDKNGYSSEGDGVMPVEVALIFENTTIIDANIGLKSIERDMGVNHESRSIFNGFKVWGAKTGLSITYQADYSFRNLFLSGDGSGGTIGAYLWKHSHNHLFDNVKFADLDYAITVSKLVESGNGDLKTRNNGQTPWIFVDAVTDNVTDFYEITKEDPSTSTSYTEHSDNPIHLASADISARPTTFTIIDSSELKVDVAAGDFRFEVDGIVTDDLGSYKMGIKQAEAQGTLRLDYPERIYEFASQAKFEAFLLENGVFKDKNDSLYFIIHEYLPNRRSYEYTAFPIRIRIQNAPNSGVYATAQPETDSLLMPQNRLLSRFATMTQSSTKTGLEYDGEPIDASAWKAQDGNNNGRINCQILQRGLLPVGSFSQTKWEAQPWLDVDLGKVCIIDYIDLWNTVELNGADIETTSNHFKNFYVLFSPVPFPDTGSLATARAMAIHEIHEPNITGARKRRAFYDNLNTKSRYIRIQAADTTRIKMAEVEIIGREITQLAPKMLLAGAYDSGSGMMHDSLRAKGLLPTQEPYTALGYTGMEIDTAATAVFATTGADAIVDWVFLELRDKDDSTQVSHARTALLQRDGDIVEVDGVSPLTFDIFPEAYYIAIHHRNHLAAMTAAPIALSDTATVVDFRTIATYGTQAQTNLGGGTFGLWAGDANSDGKISYQGADSDLIPSTAAVYSDAGNTTSSAAHPVLGYHAGDLNMDGQVLYLGSEHDFLRGIILGALGNVDGEVGYVVWEEMP